MTDSAWSWRIFGFAVALNFGWEMAQMFVYAGIAQASIPGTLTCSIAALGDALYVLCIYWIGRAMWHTPTWICKMNKLSLTAILFVGFATAIGVERVALWKGIWQYRQSMPKLLFGVGVWPVLQLMVMPFAAFWLARHWPHSKLPSQEPE